MEGIIADYLLGSSPNIFACPIVPLVLACGR